MLPPLHHWLSHDRISQTYKQEEEKNCFKKNYFFCDRIVIDVKRSQFAGTTSRVAITVFNRLNANRNTASLVEQLRPLERCTAFTTWPVISAGKENVDNQENKRISDMSWNFRKPEDKRLIIVGKSGYCASSWQPEERWRQAPRL